ncbi:MAG: LLM class flavin-dependent oxidoreductase [bacterium]
MAVKFGISFGMHPERIPPPAEAFSYAERAEALGFDSLWVGDHIAFHGHYPEALATLAAFAARTRRITLGACVYLLPLRRPAIAAKAAATVDYLSEGRFIFGVGVGGEGEAEFELCGVPLKERGARTDEALEILRKLWSGEEVAHAGRFFRFGPVRQSPPPASPGGPPVWVGGRSEAAQRRAALRAEGYVSYLYSPERYAEGLDKMRAWAAEAGRELEIEAGKWTPAHHAFIYLHDDAERALRRGIENLSRRYNMDFRGIAEKYLFYGPAERCREQVEAFKAAGAAHFIFKHAGPAEEEADQMARLAEEFIPEGGR